MFAGGRYVASASYAGSAIVRPSRAVKKFIVGCPTTRPSGGCESLLADPRPKAGATVHVGQTLTIVAMNDGPLGTDGALAPTAVLNTGRSLPVTTEPTSGWRPGYVDTNGGSIGIAYQLLLGITLPLDVAPGKYTILVTAYDVDGDSDQWYWPITVAPGCLQHRGTIRTPLFPGRARHQSTSALRIRTPAEAARSRG